MHRSSLVITAVTVTALGLAASARSEEIAAIANVLGTPTLIRFDSAAPALVTIVGPVSGLGATEQVLGLDYRPANGDLYAITSDDRLVRVDRHTAIATVISRTAISTPLSGDAFGFDFNPQIDRIRNVSDVGQNLVLNPNTGALQLVATPVFYPAGDPHEGATPNVVHHAYDNNNAAVTTTQLRAIDSDLDILVKQANNAGTLTSVGDLGVDFSPIGGFDVSGATGNAYAISTTSILGVLGSSLVYSINLESGQATLLGDVGIPLVNLLSVEAMTVVPEPNCPGDLDLNGSVDATDLALLLGAWNTDADRSDLDNDGDTGSADLAILLGAWGPCPG
jgi:hypothetical protein